MRYVLAALAVIGICLFLLLCGLAGKALAHSWYDSYCCNDKDCGPIDSGTVRVVAKGYMVNLNGTEVFVSHEETRPSGDDKFHICLIPTEAGVRVRCFYAPPMGV